MTTWRPAPGYEGRYEVSDQGEVRSLVSGRPLTPYRDRGGYLRVGPRSDRQKKRSIPVHRLVLEAFIGPRPAGLVVRHLNGDRNDNSLPNLTYGTPAENAQDSLRHGTNANSRKGSCPYGHAYDETNTRSYRGQRRCRACDRDRHRMYRLVRHIPEDVVQS